MKNVAKISVEDYCMHRTHFVSTKYLLFLFFFYTLLFNEVIASVIPVFGYEDELIAVMALPIWGINKLRRIEDEGRIGVFPYIFAFLFLSLMGTVIYKYQTSLEAVLPDLILCSKFWLCIYTSRELFSDLDIEAYAEGLYFHIRLVTIFYFVLSIVNIVYEIFPYYDIRFGIGSVRLFYSHPTVLQSCCSFLIMIIMGIHDHIKHPHVYVTMLIITVLTTLRIRALGNLVLLVAIYYFGIYKQRNFSFRSLLLFIPIVVLIGWDQFEYYFITLGEGSARLQLVIKSFTIANEHFPIGSGFASFGSYFSAVFYSPVYYKYGLNRVYGMSKELTSFIGDSFWPMVLGQAGYFGLCSYIIAVIQLIKHISSLKYIDWCFYFSALGCTCYLLMDSTAETAFVHPLSMPMAMWIGILTSYIDKREKVE